MEYGTMNYNAVEYRKALQCKIRSRNEIQYHTMQFSTIYYCEMQYMAIQYNKI
jgi:hypothetical protein